MQHTNDSTAYDFNTYGGRDYGYDAPALPARSYTSAKQTSRAMRVWLENKTLLEAAGFRSGVRYSATYAKGCITLTVDPEGKGKVSSCKRGDAVRPIIDLHSAKVAECFDAGVSLAVTYTCNAIVITVVPLIR